MELTECEKALIQERRAEREKEEAAIAFQQKAIKTALAWAAWSNENKCGLTFSTFVNQFNYQENDCKQMFNVVGKILDAALPPTC